MPTSNKTVLANGNTAQAFPDAPRRATGWNGLSLLLGVVCLAGLSGCAIGQAGYLDDYGAVGGKWERGNPTSGRVGSPFSDAGTIVQTEQQSPSAAEEAPAAPSEAAPVAPAAKSNASDESVPARIPFEGVELSLSDG